MQLSAPKQQCRKTAFPFPSLLHPYTHYFCHLCRGPTPTDQPAIKAASQQGFTTAGIPSFPRSTRQNLLLWRLRGGLVAAPSSTRVRFLLAWGISMELRQGKDLHLAEGGGHGPRLEFRVCLDPAFRHRVCVVMYGDRGWMYCFGTSLFLNFLAQVKVPLLLSLKRTGSYGEVTAMLGWTKEPSCTLFCVGGGWEMD